MSSKVTKGKENLFYGAFTVLTLLILVFCLSSKTFMPNNEPVMQTPLYTNLLGLDQTNVKLESWKYSPKKSIMEVILRMKNIGSDAIKPTFSFQAKDKKEYANLPTEIVYNDEEMYVVHIKNIPEKFKVIGLIIKEIRNSKVLEDMNYLSESEDIDNNNQTNTSAIKAKQILVTGDYRKVEIDNHIGKKESYLYILESIQSEITRLNQKIKYIKENQIPIQDKVILALEKDIVRLKKDQKYQTKNEIAETNSRIKNKEASIDDAKKIQENLRQKIKSINEKVQKLKAKKKDVELKSHSKN